MPALIEGLTPGHDADYDASHDEGGVLEGDAQAGGACLRVPVAGDEAVIVDVEGDACLGGGESRADDGGKRVGAGAGAGEGGAVGGEQAG